MIKLTYFIESFLNENIRNIQLKRIKYAQISQLKQITMSNRLFNLWKNLAPKSKKYLSSGFGTTLLAFGAYQILSQQSKQSQNSLIDSVPIQSIQLKQTEEQIRQQSNQNALPSQPINLIQQTAQSSAQKITTQSNQQSNETLKQAKNKNVDDQGIQNESQKKQNRKKWFEQATKPIYSTMKQIKTFPLGDQSFEVQGPFLIIADLPYNQSYENQLLGKVDKVRKSIGQANKNLQIFKLDLQDQKNKEFLASKYKVNFKDELIFLLRNSYDSQLASIDYPLFSQYPNILRTYLKNLNFQSSDLKSINSMGSHEAAILFVTDKLNQDQVQHSKRLITAKYLQLELMVGGLEKTKICVVDREDALKSKLLTQQNARPNTIHIIRRKNAYTTQDPNLWLNDPENNEKTPFHVVQDIPLYDKKGNNTIPHYLNQIQTFSSAMVTTPFICSITVDRNRISTDEYNQILKTFGELKKKRTFPNINYILKFDKIPYMGPQIEQNDFWMIKVTDIYSLDLQTIAHQVKSFQQLKQLGIDQQLFQRDTFQYLYKSHSLDVSKISQFINNSIQRKQESFFRTEKKNPLEYVHKITANSFQHDIIDDQSDHLVFQYSDHCITCKTMSPLIAYLDQVYKKLPIDARIKPPKIHSLNCDKNRIKGQLYSPYTPNLMYYKHQWKQHGPIRFPIETLNREGPMGLHNFCAITSQVGSIPWSLVEQAVQKQKQRRNESKLD